MSTYVVGDIQGCLQPLQCLLKEVHFNPHNDVLWAVGDIVNRGPNCLETLRFLYGMRNNLVMVLGNHDLHLLAVAAGVRRPSRSDTLQEILAAPDAQQMLDWLTQQPLLHHEQGYTLVHAGIPPQWTLAQARAYAAEVETVLQSPAREEFLGAMYGDEPAHWSEMLTGMTRLRVITNYLTRMRFCSEDGVLDLHSKGTSPQAEHHTGVEVAPWFSHTRRKMAQEKILFGHWATLLGRTDDPNALALDTGCVWNGALTMYTLETGEWIRCNCQDGEPAGETTRTPS